MNSPRQHHPGLNPLTPTGALRAGWAIFMVVAATFLVAAFSIGFTIHQQRVSDLRWCDLFVTLETPEAPPTNERSRIVQGKVSDLAEKLHCHDVAERESK